MPLQGICLPHSGALHMYITPTVPVLAPATHRGRQDGSAGWVGIGTWTPGFVVLQLSHLGHVDSCITWVISVIMPIHMAKSQTSNIHKMLHRNDIARLRRLMKTYVWVTARIRRPMTKRHVLLASAQGIGSRSFWMLSCPLGTGWHLAMDLISLGPHDR